MDLYDITVQNNKGEPVSLAQYKGKVLLIVNTATKCGFTPQYEALEALYEAHRDEGFEILDFPCNQFAFQAPGDDEKIDTFCKLRFDTKFPALPKSRSTAAANRNFIPILKVFTAAGSNGILPNSSLPATARSWRVTPPR